MLETRSSSLIGLVAELEKRLTGRSVRPGLETSLAGAIPQADTYVLVVIDGLGVAQLDHTEAARFRSSIAGTLASPFPTTTSVALSTLATGLEPLSHGLVSHLMWLPDLGQVVNSLKWVDLTGAPVNYDYSSVLPPQNTWERLRENGIEPITVQPAAFEGSPLSRLLYRGARFEPAWDDRDLVEATVSLASEPGRLIMTYLWQVDFAGHVNGLGSEEFTSALRYASDTWIELASRIPHGAALIGTADHGLVEYGDNDKIVVREERFSSLRFGGDPRGVHLWGDAELMEDFSDFAGGALVEPEELYGGQPTDRVGTKVVMAPEGKVILPPGFDKRLRCYHGGLDPAEVQIPLLVG